MTVNVLNGEMFWLFILPLPWRSDFWWSISFCIKNVHVGVIFFAQYTYIISFWNRQTPLHEAVLDSKLDALAILLARGADTTARDVSGKTPLALAKYMRNKDAVAIIERDNGQFLFLKLYTDILLKLHFSMHQFHSGLH